MFTGIIEELGVIKSLTKTGSGAELAVESKVCLCDARIGDSMNINGACLTVVDIKENILSFDISNETLTRTNLSRLKPGERINIERSLRADSRLGGHFVTGHIDGIGKITLKAEQDEFVEIEIEMDPSLKDYLVEKGSVAVDGVSLTVNRVRDKSFTVMLIPHTLSATTLGQKKAGDYVNIEVDILAKYVEKLTNKSTKQPAEPSSNITKSLLKEHGFL